MAKNRRIGALTFIVASICIAAASMIAAPDSASAKTPPPKITITIDDTVITQLLKMIATHDDSDDDINNWISLPGNRQLVLVGAQEGNLTVDQLRANVKAVIDGTATDQNQPPGSFGRVYIANPSDYSTMLDTLHKNEASWLNLCSDRDTSFAPNGVVVNQTVYLHLGGDWDAINRGGAIYIDMAFFHDNFRPSWAGLNLLISHETFHAVQNAAFGNPELTDTPDDEFYTALSKIQREGCARYVEVGADPGGYPQGTYGFFFRAVDDETIRDFPESLGILSDLTSSCFSTSDDTAFQDQITQGLDSGGPYYTIGEGIAQAIDKYDGRGRFIRTVSSGPLDFFDCYIKLTRHHSELASIPADTASQIERLVKQRFVPKSLAPQSGE